VGKGRFRPVDRIGQVTVDDSGTTFYLLGGTAMDCRAYVGQN
jgi:hypothetical protein